MALDEALLVCAPAESLVLRIYCWAGPAVTFGYGQPWAAAMEAARPRGIPPESVVRRATGGGIVFHDGDLTFSLVFPWPRLSPPAEIYEKIHSGVLRALQGSGSEARLWRSGSGAGQARQAQCFTGPEPCDLVDEAGRKILGGALRRRSARGLYQGSLRLEGLERERLKLEAAMAAGLAREWGQEPSREFDATWLRAAEALVVKYGSEAWNRRR
jgi:lipoate-protein ligase A